MHDLTPTLRGQLGDLATVLRDVRGPTAKVTLLRHLIASRIAGRRGGARSGDLIRVPFRRFEAEFELSQGEITPYAQMVRDEREGVLPTGAEVAGWTVMDCGANVGLFSLFMRGIARVVAVEPNPEVSVRLQRNFEINDFNATVIRAAITDVDGSVRMDFGGPSVLAEIGDVGSEVRSARIDTLLEEAGVDQVDLLKLDVEYHEIEALRGASAALADNRIKRVVAEFTDEESLAALDEHLSAHDFRRVTTGRFNARFER